MEKDGENDKDKGLQNAARVAFIAINNDPTGGVSTSQGLQYSQAKSWQKYGSQIACHMKLMQLLKQKDMENVNFFYCNEL